MLGNWISDPSAPLIMPSHYFHVSAFAAVSVACLDHTSASPHLRTKPDFRITQALLPTLVLALALACLPSGPAERGLALGFGVEPTWFSRAGLARVLDDSASRK